MAFIRKNKGMLMCILIRALISYCIIFETNKYIYRCGYLCGLLTVKVILDKGEPKFL